MNILVFSQVSLIRFLEPIIKKSIQDMRIAITKKENAGRCQDVPSIESEPPDDFHLVSIFPTVGDLNDQEPFLRKNIRIGKNKFERQ